jgi:hypothetical protein
MTTYTTQPDETDGIDTYIDESAATTNYGTNAEIKIGAGSGALSARTLLKFDLTKGTNPPPLSAVASSAVITLYLNSEASSNAVTMDFYKALRNWVEAQATWNVYSTGNNWGTAGCANTTTDRENTILAQLSLSATEAAGSKTITLNADGLAVVQGWINGTISNYGLLAKTSSEAANTRYLFASATDATSGNRPKLVVEYIAGGQAIMWTSE